MNLDELTNGKVTFTPEEEKAIEDFGGYLLALSNTPGPACLMATINQEQAMPFLLALRIGLQAARDGSASLVLK